MAAAFGSPSPLPGQPGFNAKTSDVLARETTEMEVVLARLNTDIEAEEEIRNAAESKFGGARWRSARIDRGSVRSYAKDVKNRFQQHREQAPPHGVVSTRGSLGSQGRVKTHAGAGARAASALRDEKKRQNMTDQVGDSCLMSASESDLRGLLDPGYASKEVSEWSVRNTLEWLNSLGLSKLRKVFEQNEISGSILLEVGSDDLDYMNIKVLAHRKRILRGIEELRQGTCRPNVNVHQHAVPPLRHEERCGMSVSRIESDVPNTDSEVGLEKKHESSRVKSVQHVFQVRPLSDNQAEDTDGQTNTPVVNLAQGYYDETAAHSSFADAVEEWRRCQKQYKTGTVLSPTKAGSAAPGALRDGTITINGSNTPASGKSEGLLSCSAAGEFWTNPFASPQARETKAMQTASAYRLASPESTRPSPSQLSTTPTASVSSGQTASITPTLDEEAEHAAFRRAVAEWNFRGKVNTKDQHDPEGDKGRADEESATQDTALPRWTAEAMAEALRKQMDDEHRAQAQKLEGLKKNALEGLEAARRYIGTNFHNVPSLGGEVEDCCSAEKEFTYSQHVEGESKWSLAEGRYPKDEEEPEPRCSREVETESFSTTSTQDFGKDSESKECDGVQSDVMEEGRGVEIEFVESVLGGDLPCGDDMRYLVDENGSEEEGGM